MGIRAYPLSLSFSLSLAKDVSITNRGMGALLSGGRIRMRVTQWVPLPISLSAHWVKAVEGTEDLPLWQLDRGDIL